MEEKHIKDGLEVSRSRKHTNQLIAGSSSRHSENSRKKRRLPLDHPSLNVRRATFPHRTTAHASREEPCVPSLRLTLRSKDYET
eukprot:1052-Amphidinium_carterae.1